MSQFIPASFGEIFTTLGIVALVVAFAQIVRYVVLFVHLFAFGIGEAWLLRQIPDPLRLKFLIAPNTLTDDERTQRIFVPMKEHEELALMKNWLAVQVLRYSLSTAVLFVVVQVLLRALSTWPIPRSLF
jgi:hypothetical protein